MQIEFDHQLEGDTPGDVHAVCVGVEVLGGRHGELRDAEVTHITCVETGVAIYNEEVEARYGAKELIHLHERAREIALAQ